MIFALASFGTRGSVEPCAAVGRELLHRGHEVRMAVPPDLVGFAEAAGLAAVASGPDAHAALDRDFTRNLFGDPAHNLRIRNLIRLGREYLEFAAQCWGESSTTLTSLADGADLLLTGGFTEAQAANVASFTTFRWPRCIPSPCGPTASSCHSCRRRWAAAQWRFSSGCLGAR
jgi:UDP:flavonoid glycosyltransferase YjiC (YdhE family)